MLLSGVRPHLPDARTPQPILSVSCPPSHTQPIRFKSPSATEGSHGTGDLGEQHPVEGARGERCQGGEGWG